MRGLSALATLLLVLAACSDEDTSSPLRPVTAKAHDDGGASSSGSAPQTSSDAGAGGTTTSPGDAGGGTTPPPDPPEEHEGEATYFAAGTLGACGTKTPADKLVGALGPSLYSKDVCGQCAEVTGPKGTVTVVINDRCAGCKGASMDLSTEAFTQIATKSQGRVKITWHYVDCP